MRGNSNLETAERLRWRRVAVLVVAAAAVVGGASAAEAATWWRNTTTTGLWSDAALWSNAASGGTTGAPANDTTTDVVVFNQTAVTGNAVVTLNAATSITGITVANTGLTTLQSSDATARTLSIGASGITANAGSGGLTIGTSGSLVGVSIAANQTWTNNAASPITVAGDLSGSANLTKGGTGTLAFSGASTHAGTFTINAGTVQLGNTGTSSLSRVVMANTAGATLQLTGSAATLRSISGGGASGGNVDLGSAMLTLQNDVATDYGGVMSGSGGVTKSGAAVAFRFTAQQTYTGPTVVITSFLTTLTDNAIASTAYVQTAGGIFDISNRPQTIGGLTGTSGGVHSFNGSGGSAGSLTLNVASGTSYTYGGNIGSTLPGFSLIKAGGGTQILTASNSYNGGTTITGGTLQLNPGASIVGGIVNNATLTLNGTTAFTTANNISGTGGLVKSGASGAVTLTGTNTYSGTTTITGGFLVAGSTTGLSASSVVVTAGGVLDISQRAVTIGGLSGVTNSVHSFSGTTAGSLTLAVASGTLTYGGQVGGSYPNFSLTKTGLGTQILSGSNNYTGATTITGGTLALGSAGQFSSSPTIIVGNAGSSGAVLDLTAKTGTFTFTSSQTVGGTGTINIGAGKTVSSAGIWAPGNSIGSNTVTGNLSLSGTSQFELGTPGTSTSAPGTSDFTAVSGTLTLGGNLTLLDNAGANGNGSAAGGVYRLFTYGNAVSGSYASVTTNPTATTRTSLSNIALGGSGTGSGQGVFLSIYNLAAGNVVSSTSVNFGTVLKNTPLSQALSITNTAPNNAYSEKLGTAFGAATGLASGSGSWSLLSAGGTSTALSVYLASGSAGLASGSQVLNYTSDGAGSSGLSAVGAGSQTVNLSATILDPAAASFGSGPGATTSLTLNFSTVNQGDVIAPQNFSLYNLLQTAGYTADLALLSITPGVGNSAALTTNLTTFNSLASGSFSSWQASVNTASQGTFSNTWTLEFKSSNGGTVYSGDTAQTLTLTTNVIVVPEPGALALTAAGVGLAAAWAQRRRRK